VRVGLVNKDKTDLLRGRTSSIGGELDVDDPASN
jgi:hypothetical protein